MTKKEFDAFLQPLGLIWEHHNLPVTNAGAFDIGHGWYEITAKLITDLIDLGWDKKLFQVKEKFGGGRFYIGGANRPIFDRIREWEILTYKTCEHCGTQENITTAGYIWIRTLCDNCREQKK